MTMVIGKVIKMPCMRRGVCGYIEENLLVTQEALENMAPSVQGIPVVIEHQKDIESKIDELIVGRVADMHYNADDDLWYAHFVIDDPKAVDLLKNGYGVSTAYTLVETRPGGSFNNIPYDREVVKAKYNHLAIVKTPRYEMAKNPEFCNSKDNGGKKVFEKFFKVSNKKEEVKIEEGEKVFVLVNGVETDLADVVGAVEKAQKQNTKHVLNQDDEIDVMGTRMSVAELLQKYDSLVQNKKNEEDEKKKKEEDEKAEKEKEGKKNSAEEKKNFEDLQQKRNASEHVQIDNFDEYKTVREMVIEGQMRYGTPKGGK